MAEITAQVVNEFRKATGLGLMECKALLKEADGDPKKAMVLAQEKGKANAAKRAGRAAKAGRVEVYIHHDGKSGALIEVNCETDFVARNDEFRQLCKDLALHVVAANPVAVRREEVATDVVEDAALTASVAKLAGRLANGPAFAYGTTKSLLTRELDVSLGAAIELEAMTQALLMHSEDFNEFYAAWGEGRRPDWSGR